MRITETQEITINKLICERLSSNEGNILAVNGFYNRKNDNIAQVLLNEAFEEDANGATAYYVVKHPNGTILLFFSLKCGLLYDHFFDVNKFHLLKELVLFLESSVAEGDINEEEKKTIEIIREQLRSLKGISKADLEKLPKKGNTIVAELEKEFNEDITRVGKTFSAIELVHFCSNSDADELWKSLELPRGRGSIAFWHFIVPKIFEIQRHIGCQYLFLFAADDSKDEHLINYYEDQLNFVVSDSLATAKPVYDFTCKFMFQEISELEQAQKDFFEHFNPDEA